MAGDVAGEVDLAQLLQADAGVPLVLAAGPKECSPSPRKCLALARTALRVGCVLKAADMAAGPSRLRPARATRRSFLVGAPPALVAGDGDAGAERPARSGAGHLAGRHPRRSLDDVGVAEWRRSRSWVREQHCALDVAVAVNGVDAVEDAGRRAGSIAPGSGTESVISAQMSGAVRLGQRVGARQHRAHEELVDFAAAVLERVLVGLGHLADLFVQGHLPDERFDVGGRQAGLARRRDVGSRSAAAAWRPGAGRRRRRRVRARRSRPSRRRTRGGWRKRTDPEASNDTSRRGRLGHGSCGTTTRRLPGWGTGRRPRASGYRSHPGRNV